jgi:hypothetical protein
MIKKTAMEADNSAMDIAKVNSSAQMASTGRTSCQQTHKSKPPPTPPRGSRRRKLKSNASVIPISECLIMPSKS